MQLSTRARRLKPSSTLAISTKVKQLRAAGEDVIGFGAGEPDFDTPQPIKDAAIAALQAGRTGYAPVAGDPDARAAIAAKLRTENGIDCAPEHVVISTGAKQSLYLTLQALVDPGTRDEVVILTPAWVSYFAMVELAGGTAVEVPATVDTDFKITPGQLDAALGPRTAAVMLNSPSNPCGTMYTESELRALATVIERHAGVAVISDEIYEKLVYTDIAPFSMGSIDAIADRVITVNGVSKAFAMTGWRLGYLGAPGQDGLVAKAATRLQSQMTSHPTSFCYPAIVTALEMGDTAIEPMRRVFAERAVLISELVNAWPDVRCSSPTGAFYVFPDLSPYMGRRSESGREITDAATLAGCLLDEAKVAVVPGNDFGTCAINHVRLSFATDDTSIREGCRRIADWLATLVKGAPAGI